MILTLVNAIKGNKNKSAVDRSNSLNGLCLNITRSPWLIFKRLLLTYPNFLFG